MEYTELEKKVIAKGLSDFRKELGKASEPMVEVLKKYGLSSNDELLKTFFLRVPAYDDYYKGAVYIPGDKVLERLHGKILELFMEEIKNLQDRVNNLPIH